MLSSRTTTIKVGWTRFTTYLLLGISVVVLVLAAAGYLLFHGSFDRGKFETLSTTWSSTRKVALVAKRSDHEALSSDQFFVVISDRTLSSGELRHSYYYGNGLVFRSGADCLNAQWNGPQKLLVLSCGEQIPADYIAAQQDQLNGIAISYTNIQHKRQ